MTQRNVVVADRDKFSASAFIRTAGFDDLETVITGLELARDELTRLKSAGMKVVLA